MVAKVFLSLVALVFAPTSLAEVTAKSANGFAIEISTQVNGPRQAVYQQFLQIGQWWDSSHTYSGDAANMYLEPKAGGRFYEKTADMEVLHMTVTYVKPGHAVHMTGGLGPLQMMGIHGGMSWEFKKLDDQKTQVVHRYQVTGFMEGGLEQLAAVVDRVQAGQVERLRLALEK
ncbi:SRPBCC domain-containing protein [bacterium SCSIO 12696]|nr:SRPBCC domain-containing protein [bacterium SCSIO 12696]